MLSSAPSRRRCLLYVQMVTVTSHGPRPAVRSADRIDALGVASTGDAGGFPARLVRKTPPRMRLKKADQRRERFPPFTRAQLSANGIHQLIAVDGLPVSDALAPRALRYRITFHEAALAVQYLQ